MKMWYCEGVKIKDWSLEGEGGYVWRCEGVVWRCKGESVKVEDWFYYCFFVILILYFCFCYLIMGVKFFID